MTAIESQSTRLRPPRRPFGSPGKAGQPVVRFESVSKHFGAYAAVERLTLDILPGEFFALLGPSGCGKTTLLRLLAGFEAPDEGRILLDGADLAGIPPHRRPVNMMFQSYALFPHLSVARNVAFGLRQERLSRPEIDERVTAMMALLQLDGLGQRRPDQLSGGQRQRVALARSLVKRPRVLLLDEPMAALDKKLRQQTQYELMRLQAKLGLAFVIVTHDQEEAMTVASRIGVMQDGRLVQVGTPAEIYEKPNARWVADFIGEVNLIEGHIIACTAEICQVEAGGIHFRFAARGDLNADARVWVALRPEKIAIAPHHAASPGEGLVGVVQEVGYRGDISMYRIRLDNGAELRAAAANTARAVDRVVTAGDRVVLSWASDAAVVLTQ